MPVLPVLVWTVIWNLSQMHVWLMFFHFFPSALCQHYLEPPLKLSEALERYGLKTEDFFVLKHGESRYLNTDENWINTSTGAFNEKDIIWYIFEKTKKLTSMMLFHIWKGLPQVGVLCFV